ncbi:hypothetical protein BKA67DRAFT_536788 [Truncatella angustata]|uniref:Nephrocystin 3-like N-terminal domain-containing protein n=1 Tax=Truncatella angustata TaxID=152316 RepID=A0A9P8UJ46_9PEZI|nr:uncharacterized protein BKA67DRAFT_536788 [Truncatella angustata]KAH6653092.1 hypothetical protein BKA67DRAFT_536788 [Truncatella angustata]
MALITTVLILFKARLAKPVHIRPKRHVALRVQDIPTAKSREVLRNDLAEIAATDSILDEAVKTINRISLVPVSKQWACATASFCTSLSDTELVERFSRATKGRPIEYKYDCTFYGITPLYDDEAGAKIDILAVPGLASHAVGSWKAPGGNDVWLRDFLPDDVGGIRVLLYGYDTDLRKTNSRKSIEDMGKMLLESVTAFRAELQALIHASKRTRYDLSTTCCGLLFFGVPNHGLRNEQLHSLVQGQPNEALIRDLLVDRDTEPSTFLKRVSSQFAECCKGQYPVISFYELQHSPVVEKHPDGSLTKSGDKVLMVTEKSATSTGITAVADEDNIPFDTDHSGLVKFSARSQESYQIVKDKIKNLATEGVAYVSQRSADNLSDKSKQRWRNLNNPPYDSFRNSSKLAKPEPGTLEWLIDEDDVNLADTDANVMTLRSSDFISWRDSDETQRLLITGNPGQGKSVLSNFIVTNLERNNFTNSKVIYYFCNIKIDEAQRNARAVLRSLIVQLCETRQELFQILPSDLADNSDRFFTASIDRLLHIFEQMLEINSYDQVYCVIDGLDVYDDGMDELIVALSRIFISPGAKAPLTKLICTSRPGGLVHDAWGQSQCRILRCNAKDLKLFIESRVTSLGPQFTDDMKASLKVQLFEHAKQTFLWIDVVVRRTRAIRIPSLARIKETIAKSSADLEALYAQLVHDIIQLDQLYARILVWAIYARRPLYYTELADAAAIEPNVGYTSYAQYLEHRPNLTPNLIYRTLGTLLDVLDDKVYPIHQSIKDFFETKKPLGGYFGSIEARLWPAYVSMTYLRCVGPRTRSADSHSFFQYGSVFWFSHIASANDIYDNPDIKCQLSQVLDITCWKAQAWMNYLWSERGQVVPESISQIAVDLDIGWLAEVLLDRKIDLLVGNFSKDSFISSAGRNGAVLRVLLGHNQARHIMLPEQLVPIIFGKFGRNVVHLLLEHRGNETTITEEVVKAAAGNEWNGKEVMALLLAKRPDDVVITEGVVKAAVGNGLNGKKVMALLLEKRPDDVVITEKVVKAAAGNVWNGKEVMALLLEKRPDDVVITEGVVKAAVGNGLNGKKVMALLLEKRPDDVVITEEVVRAAAGNEWNGKEVMALLLERRPNDVVITEKVVKAAVGNCIGVMALLLEKRSNDVVVVTKDIVKAAAGNVWNGKKVMALLLEKKPDNVVITEEVVFIIAQRFDILIMALLLEKRPDVMITEEVVKAAAGSYIGDKVMALFLEKRPDNVVITEEVVSIIAQRFDILIMALLLEKRPDVIITEKVVKAAAGSYNGDKVMALLLEKRSNDVVVTKDIVKAAAGNVWNGKKVMALLLEERPDDVVITEEVVRAAAGNEWNGKEVMALLLEKRPDDVVITEEVVRAAAGNERNGKEAMALLLGKRPDDVVITEEVVKAAAGNEWNGKEVMALLLEKRPDDVVITEEVVKAAAGIERNRKEVMALLLEKRPNDVVITEEVVKAERGIGMGGR